jgi:hypothetical protein
VADLRWLLSDPATAAHLIPMYERSPTATAALEAEVARFGRFLGREARLVTT